MLSCPLQFVLHPASVVQVLIFFLNQHYNFTVNIRIGIHLESSDFEEANYVSGIFEVSSKRSPVFSTHLVIS